MASESRLGDVIDYRRYTARGCYITRLVRHTGVLGITKIKREFESDSSDTIPTSRSPGLNNVCMSSG